MVAGVPIGWRRAVANYHFWVVVALFAASIVLNYPQQILSITSPSLFSSFGATGGTVERFLLVLPVGYASLFLSARAGLVSLALVCGIMVPHVFLVSEQVPQALFEAVAVLIIGGLTDLGAFRYRREKTEQQRILTHLEASSRQLLDRTDELEASQRHLVTINQISNTVSQSLELPEILDSAINSVIGLIQVDAAWVYILNRDNTELDLAAYRGFSDATCVVRATVGQGLDGKVVESRQPMLIHEVPGEAASAEAANHKMMSVIVVPLVAKGMVNGTLGVGSRRSRFFSEEHVQLLTIAGYQIGAAVENARLYQRQTEMQEQLRQAYTQLAEAHERLKESQNQLVQAEKLSSLGQLSASIAHEVNNPLSGVLVYARLLSKKISAGNIERDVVLMYLSRMEDELVRSTRLIRNLLDFSRQSTPEMRIVSMNVVVNRALDLVAHVAETQRVQIVKELDSSLPDIVADPDQLQQVCTNLILNAVQAMPAGGKLSLVTSLEGAHVRLEVRDTGHGIPPENMNKLFTPFFTTKGEVKGVGLGLAVAHGIVQRHKGRIEVQSKPGEGTVFSVYLPLDPESAGYGNSTDVGSAASMDQHGQ